MDPEITPISILQPFRISSIRARVSYKTEITPWNNGDKDGKIFLINLIDKSGEITALVFNDLCMKFYRQIQAGCVYVFSNVEARPAHDKYKVLGNSLQILFLDNTVIQLDNTVLQLQIPQTKYNFVDLSTVSKIRDGEPVDVIGICTNAPDYEHRRNHTIREIVLLDPDYQEVMLNLWEEGAVNFDGDVDDVIVVKGARVREHNNEKKLNAGWYSMVQINPDIPDAIGMRKWYENQ
ncbi:replication protein A 70 kDa DNA-binding subunit-like [Drosophila gunungcola]|uniref:Replication protein A OB domain-containing protein n=1 Tax=Drosophila gunungcola TaxID=103775 RepID=A0A9P9YY65_9MUSC|nr:replication protein A 70 kDa DNA-binding subunit-like [Drosophila gunungcola]KAI8045325.1 hypothetical protein M5D96_001505 [Drosophila gunungcola]